MMGILEYLTFEYSIFEYFRILIWYEYSVATLNNNCWRMIANSSGDVIKQQHKYPIVCSLHIDTCSKILSLSRITESACFELARFQRTSLYFVVFTSAIFRGLRT